MKRLVYIRVLAFLLLCCAPLQSLAQVDDSYYAQFDSLARAQDSLNRQTLLVDTAAVDSLAFSRALRVFQQGNYALAEPYLYDYTNRFMDSPRAPQAHLLLAKAQGKLGKPDQERANLQLVLTYGASDAYAEANKLLAPIYASRKEFSKAFEAYRLGAEAAASSDELASMRSENLVVAQNTKDPEKIILAANELLSTPNLPEGKRNFAYYQRAHGNLAAGHYDQAFQDFFALAKLPYLETAAEARYRLVEIRFIQERWKDVERLTLAAASVSTPHQYWIAKGYLIMARAKAKMGEFSDAKTILRSLLEKYANETDGIYKEAQEGLLALYNGKSDW